MLCPPQVWLYPHMGWQTTNRGILQLRPISLFFLAKGKVYVNYNHLAKQIKCSFEILVLEKG